MVISTTVEGYEIQVDNNNHLNNCQVLYFIPCTLFCNAIHKYIHVEHMELQWPEYFITRTFQLHVATLMLSLQENFILLR